jgi:diguanylate cyclase (GGDEF)-like protein
MLHSCQIHQFKARVLAIAGLGQRFADSKRNLDFLRGSIYSILAWPFICLLLTALLWGVILTKLENDKTTIKQNAFKHASSLSKGYAEQLARTVDQIDQITLTLKYYWKERRGALHLEKQLEEGLYPASGQLYVTLVDRYGTRVASTMRLEKKPAPSLAARDFFRQHRDDASKGLLISPAEPGLRSREKLVRFSRRLETAEGAFDGLVIVSVAPAYLASFTDVSSLSKNDFLTVRRSDGPLLAAETGDGIDPLTAVVGSPPVFESDRGVAAMAGEKFADGESRIVAWHKLSSYPLVSTVGLSEQEIAESYRLMARDYRHMAVAATLFLLLAALVGMVVSSRLAWRKQQAEEVKNAYRLATDGAREGFYMMRAVYDENDGIIDFLFEDCNERGAAYYATTKAQLIGMKFTDLYSSTNAQHILGRYLRAMETGFYEDEVRVWPHSPLQATWIHRRLVRSGAGLAVTLRDISDMKAQEEALSRLANADAVTALPNRHWLINYLPDALTKARNRNTVLALLFVDLDDFKNINDTLGHASGDELLQAVATRLQAMLRPQDSVVRLGGDEFTIILEHVDGHADVSSVAERIMKSLGEPFMLSGGSSHEMHASIGISMFPQDGNDGPTLLKHADIAMYAAKTSGKGHYEFYQPFLSENLVVRLDREQALRKAIEHDEFVLYYQPRVDTFSGQLRSMEALVRWMRPDHGPVPPLEFIPMAEDTGLIVPLGELVIRKACAQLAQWKAQQLPVVPVSINVSPKQFSQGNLSALFAICMADHSIDPSLIEIEITESCMMGEDHTVTAELAALESLGIKLLVDDFGTGYSSLSQLQRLDLDVLKVDRAFTAQLCNGKEGEALFMAILSMAHVLGMGVVAEGVETIEQLRVLQALSCNEVQGYFISPPVPADQIPMLMRKRFLFPELEQLALAI